MAFAASDAQIPSVICLGPRMIHRAPSRAVRLAVEGLAVDAVFVSKVLRSSRMRVLLCIFDFR
jgi:hypothetical protein